MAQPAEVACVVVRRVAVNVIHSIIVNRIVVRTESLCYQTADKPVSRLTVAAEADALIAFVIDEGFENARIGVFETFDAPTGTD